MLPRPPNRCIPLTPLHDHPTRQVDREFRSRINHASRGSSADHVTAAHNGRPAMNGRRRSVGGSLVSPSSTAPERERDEGEDSEEGGGLDWLDGIEREAAGARSRPGGAPGVKHAGGTLLGDDAAAHSLPVLESIGDRAEYESALVALKVGVVGCFVQNLL